MRLDRDSMCYHGKQADSESFDKHLSCLGLIGSADVYVTSFAS